MLALTKELMSNMKRRSLPEKAKFYAIYDFSISKNSDVSKQLHFLKELVEKV